MATLVKTGIGDGQTLTPVHITELYDAFTGDKLFDTENPTPSTSWCPHRIFNIGNPKNTQLLKFIECLEKELDKIILWLNLKF